MRKAIVTGASSGLGRCIRTYLEQDKWLVDNWSLDAGIDVSSQLSIQDAIAQFSSGFQEIDLVINCAGVNYINWHEDIPIDEWDRLMAVNARAPWLITKELIKAEAMRVPSTIVNVVSNAAHVPMTHSAAYNASKGAAHILTLQMARELRKRHEITVFGISPNKLSGTGMSTYIEDRVCALRGWTPEEAEEYQKAALPAGEETDPNAVAEFLGFLLSNRDRHKYLHGCVIPYGA